MASRQRKSATPIESSLISLLEEKPYEFEFAQALRILEFTNKGAVPLGEGYTPHDENIALSSRIFLNWPPSDLYKLKKLYHLNDTDSLPTYALSVNFMGVAGAAGPLPLSDSEKFLDQLKDKDRSGAAFLDTFNHRLLSISYRIKKEYWVGLSKKYPEETKIAKVLFSLIGLHSKELRNRLKLPDRALLYYSGLLWQQPRSLAGCEAILAHYFGLDFKIHPFQPAWKKLSKDRYTHIGFTGQLQVLGNTAALGTKAWLPSSGVKVEVGPLAFSDFEKFLKGNNNYEILSELIKFYLGVTADIDINLALKPGETKDTKLAHAPKEGVVNIDNTKNGLGWTTWLQRTSNSATDKQVKLQNLKLNETRLGQGIGQN